MTPGVGDTPNVTNKKKHLGNLGMTATRRVALAWEQEHGFDSLDTIERMYERNLGGSFCCPYPSCRFVRQDSLAMWLHIHSAHADYLPGPGFIQQTLAIGGPT